MHHAFSAERTAWCALALQMLLARTSTTVDCFPTAMARLLNGLSSILVAHTYTGPGISTSSEPAKSSAKANPGSVNQSEEEAPAPGTPNKPIGHSGASGGEPLDLRAPETDALLPDGKPSRSPYARLAEATMEKAYKGTVNDNIQSVIRLMKSPLLLSDKRAKDRTGHVYIVRVTVLDLVKVGFTTNAIDKRDKQMQNKCRPGHPWDLISTGQMEPLVAFKRLGTCACRL